MPNDTKLAHFQLCSLYRRTYLATRQATCLRPYLQLLLEQLNLGATARSTSRWRLWTEYAAPLLHM